MELWIRSQDRRTLRRVLSLDINGLEIMTSNVLLGQYKTKERALEVLDEIQSKLKNKIVMQLKKGFNVCEETIKRIENSHDIKILPWVAEVTSVPENIIIYEMPKE